MPQMDLIAELKKKQVKPQVREGKDGALEDIITGTWSPTRPDDTTFQPRRLECVLSLVDLRNTPYRRTDGRRPAPRQET